MSNRLKFFREQMAAFEGAVNPQRAIESGYYVPEPRKSVSELISRRIELRPSSTHLLLGGIGSGKTTQLLVTRDRINKIEDIYALYVDVSLYTDISEISTGVLTAVAGIVLSELLENSKNELVNKSVSLIEKLAYGHETQKIVDPLGGISAVMQTRVVVEQHRGILTTQSNSQNRELVKAVSQLNQAASSQYGKLVFLLDGLDRLDDTQALSELVATDAQDLSSIGIGLVLVAPLRALYDDCRDTLEQAVNYFDYQSCFNIEDDPEAHVFFEKILENRASEGFIEKLAMQNIIHYSGGVLRDLINLTQASIEEAYLSDSDNLQQVHVETAVASFGRAKVLGLSDAELEILADMLEGHTFLPRTKKDIRLLATGKILEYRHPERCYVIHPTIPPVLLLIQQAQEVQYSFDDDGF